MDPPVSVSRRKTGDRRFSACRRKRDFFFAGNFFVRQIKFDCSLFMVSAIRASIADTMAI
jgi:hypothetical protein